MDGGKRHKKRKKKERIKEKKTEWRGEKKEKIKITEIKILKIEERDKKPNKNWTRWRKVVKKIWNEEKELNKKVKEVFWKSCKKNGLREKSNSVQRNGKTRKR